MRRPEKRSPTEIPIFLLEFSPEKSQSPPGKIKTRWKRAGGKIEHLTVQT